MARSIHPYYTPVGAQAASRRESHARPDGSRTLAGMLLAAVVAALLVVADQLIETWADGHLLVVWVALWTVAFAALALLAPPLRQLSSSMAGAWVRWSSQRAAQRSDALLWELAEQDYRVKRDLQMAQLHSEAEAA